MSCIFSCFSICCCRDTTTSASFDGGDPIAALQAVDPDKLPLFTFKGRSLIARIVEVYDGDTCTVVFKWNGEMIKYKVRAYGYDCAEMKPKKDDPNREKEKALAVAARKRFIELVGGEDDFSDQSAQRAKIVTIVRLECLDFDKYGRILAYFYPLVDVPKPDHSNSINQVMNKEGHGKPYTGGTKESWA